MPRTIHHVSLLLLLAIFAVFRPTPALASFGDCNDPNYLQQFDPRFSGDSGFLCVESDRVAVNSDAGTSHIRIVQHLLADWAGRPGAVAAIKDGVDGAVRAMATLGHFRIEDVTILLVDGFACPPPPAPVPGERKLVCGPLEGSAEAFGEVAAATIFKPADECRIVVYMLGTGATTESGASMIAHELFHCVEDATLAREQLTTGGGGVPGGGNWWLEGAADWFSTAAVPPAPYLGLAVQSFDAHAGDTALNMMSYDAYVFFAWLGGAHGPSGVLPFLQHMATRPDESAQRAAMAGAMPPSDWLKFAEDYNDQRIHDGQGGSIDSTPADAEALEWSDTQTRRIALHPFILARRNLAFHCGRWTLVPQPASHYAAKSGDGEWGDLPGDLDNMGNSHGGFAFAAINATAEDVPFQIAATLAARCADCAGTHEMDHCLIGTWEMTTDGVQQWAAAHLHNYHITSISLVGNTLTLNDDGTFATGASDVTVSGEGHGASSSGEVNAQASGRWSTSGGNLNMCADASAASGHVTVSGDGHSVTVPTHPQIPPQSSTPYTCSGDTFTHTTQVGSMGSVTSTYNRVR